VLESWIVFRIEAAFSYGKDGARQIFDPSDSPGLAPLLMLHQTVVTSAEFGDGDAVLRQGLSQPCLLHFVGVVPGVSQPLTRCVRPQVPGRFSQT
jgi:hypothetical protein